MNETAYPLCWPAGWRRTLASDRKRGNFGKKNRDSSRSYVYKADLTVADGVRRVLEELKRMGIPDWNVIISTNLELRLDGLPRSGQKNPVDPGVAIYWLDPCDGRRCMAIDLYTKVEDNLAAIAATLDAMRAIERHGGASILDRAFAGFTALPFNPEGTRSRTWRDVLGVDVGDRLDEVKTKYRRLASAMHPDKGGSDAAMAELNEAMAQAVKEMQP